MKNLKLVFILLNLFPVMLFAQEAQRYSLRQCLQQAMTENVSILKAQLDEDEGKQKTKEVKATAYPQINATGELIDNVLRQAFVFPAALGDPNAGPDDYIVLRGGLQYTASINVQANQQIFNQSLFTGIKAAKVSEDYYRLNRERIEEETIYQVASLFYRVAALKTQQIVLETNQEELQKSLAITNDRFNNGLARKLDADRLRVSLTNIETQLATMQDTYNVLISQLKLLIGLNKDVAFDIDFQLPTDLDSAFLNYTPGTLDTEFIWEDKIEYKQLTTQRSLYQLERKNYSAGYYPTLSAFASYTYQGQTNSFFLSGDSNPLWFDVASIGLRLNIPIFDGLRKPAQMQQSRIRQIKTEKDLAFVKQQSSAISENATRSLEVNYKNFQAQRQNVQLANSIYDATEQNYNEGVSPLTDLLQAETARIQAQSQLIEALLKVKQSEIELLKANGDIKSLLN
ncbi:MAG: TolC family protein [Cyclobacteriaceae bacterium]|jgi:outer membrane protein|nr:TolC family protein [Cyclobacteriaceae bacterium]MBX2958056.1 TolC family protein [Cyclobacteriaceae bacterium]UYN85629.1 MAG: TolC family protein [Cyclobacteriaceae bacterium]HRJ29656.1 TolC family protein [Cyclobacteriaceae bacterium]HRJ81442.1 TolC family protein [Cyclobacteriaceae bacterium]